jgi:protease-4
MHIRSWETLATIIFLIICLAAGLALAELYAPKPVIGIARFEGLVDFTSAQQMGNILDAARQDDRVVGVVLEISSPGGVAGSSEKLYHAMLQLRQEKPLVVAIDSIAASGGYYMAVAGDKIYATASSEIGNVGVRAFRPFDPGISPFELSSGPYKLSGGSRFDSIRQLELTKEAFVGSVVHQRSQSPHNPLRIDADTVAEAHIYLGGEALAIGLIDAHGSRSDAILDVADMAGVKRYQVLELTDYLDLPFESSFDVRSLVDNALPGALFLLDSRIPLAGDAQERLAGDWFTSLWGESPAPVGGQSAPLSPYNRLGGSR